MNYINKFKNVQALSVSVGNSYSAYQLMHILLDYFHQGGNYTAQIESHQEDLIKEESFTNQNIYL